MAQIESRFPAGQPTPAMQEPLALQVRQVHKAFRFPGNASQSESATHKVLDGINLDIKPGELVTIVGQSGCGKSTLLNIIAGLDQPDEGEVLVRDRRGTPTSNRVVVFQEGALFPWLTVGENIEFGLKMARMSKQDIHLRAKRYLELVGLENFSESYVHQLSGGMKQRVAIARAMALEPEILLMDEPFAALDVMTRELMCGELVGLHRATSMTILFITHNIDEALLLGDRVIILSSIIHNVKKEFRIDVPRPRDAESAALGEIKRQILREFEEDFLHAKGRDPSS